jgi:hypothetical protein
MDVAGILQTVLVAYQVGATPKQRAAEVQLFKQVRIYSSLALSFNNK